MVVNQCKGLTCLVVTGLHCSLSHQLPDSHLIWMERTW